MGPLETVAVRISEPTGVAEARRAASALAHTAGYSIERAGIVSLVVTEAATNIIRHAHAGEIILSTRGRHSGIYILALDKGPGMRHVERCMQDGYSTAGGSGTGMGAMRRLSSELDIYSEPQRGTALLARVAPDLERPPAPLAAGAIRCGGVSIPMRGERACGDGWAMHSSSAAVDIIVSDGLGHGIGAAEASVRALGVFNEFAGLEHDELMERIHGALRSTRGAAVALVRVVPAGNSVQFTGVGNIDGAVIANGSVRRMVSHPGTVGHEIRKVHSFTYPFPAQANLLLHSDGISGHWSLDGYPGLENHHPTLVAGVIYRDANRGRDDATVVVARSHPA